MRAYTLTELMILTRAELFALHRKITDALALLPEGSPERLIAFSTLRDIRRVLARGEFAPSEPRIIAIAIKRENNHVLSIT